MTDDLLQVLNYAYSNSLTIISDRSKTSLYFLNIVVHFVIFENVTYLII